MKLIFTSSGSKAWALWCLSPCCSPGMPSPAVVKVKVRPVLCYVTTCIFHQLWLQGCRVRDSPRVVHTCSCPAPPANLLAVASPEPGALQKVAGHGRLSWVLSETSWLYREVWNWGQSSRIALAIVGIEPMQSTEGSFRSFGYRLVSVIKIAQNAQISDWLWFFRQFCLSLQ